MWPPGHLAFGYLCYSLAAERDWVPRATLGILLALALGSQFPDLLDKPLAWYLGAFSTSRTVGHSLFVVLPLTAALTALLSRFGRAGLGLAFGVGALTHLAIDAVPTLWLGDQWWDFLLWPLMDGHTVEGGASYTILGLLRDEATEPWFLFEYVLLGLALLRWRWDGRPGLDGLFALWRDGTGATER